MLAECVVVHDDEGESVSPEAVTVWEAVPVCVRLPFETVTTFVLVNEGVAVFPSW